VVYNVSSGEALSGSYYNRAGHYNYNNMIKSMVISRGPSAKAYVLTKYHDY